MSKNKYILIATSKSSPTQEWRGGEQIPKISLNELKRKMAQITSDLSDVLEDIDKSISKYEVNEISFHMAIHASGELSLIGIGSAGIGASSGITFVFKRKEALKKTNKSKKI